MAAKARRFGSSPELALPAVSVAGASRRRLAHALETETAAPFDAAAREA
jgi:hypothetical protein